MTHTRAPAAAAAAPSSAAGAGAGPPPAADPARAPNADGSRSTSRIGRQVLDNVKDEGAKKLAGLVIALVCAALVAWVGAKNLESLPEWLVSRIQIHRAPPAPRTKFAIMVATLDGADGSALADQLTDVLNQTPGIEVYRYPDVLRAEGPGPAADRLEAAERIGQHWLKGKNGDVLIWGRAVGPGLQLRFLPRGSKGTALGAYSPPTAVQLDTTLRRALGAQLIALAVTSMACVCDSTGRYLADVLRPAAARMDSLLRSGSPLTDEQRAGVQVAYGLAMSTIGEQTGEREPIQNAVRAYHAALATYTRERVPLYWAAVQTNLGNALGALDEGEGGTARLAEAVRAFRAALQENTRERAPLDWAATQNNLGIALRRLGARDSSAAGNARLKEAARAFRAALQEAPRERAPLRWAAAQANLGNVLQDLGNREPGTAHLEQAVWAYRTALQAYTRERAPLDWAGTQTSLGFTLATLGARDASAAGGARLEEAVQACHAALQEYTRERVPLRWAMAQVNLGGALEELGMRESGTARLDSALTTYRAAREVYATASPSDEQQLTESIQRVEHQLALRQADRRP